MNFKKLFTLSVAALALAACSPKNTVSIDLQTSVPYTIENGRIVLQTPDREPGQTSALELTAEPLDTVRVGLVGLGMRGSEMIRRFSYVEGARITAICDLEEERVDKMQSFLSELGKPTAAEYAGETAWQQLCEDPNVNLVYICTPWLLHTPIAVYAMEHGKHVAIEVPAAMSIDECWQLVNTSEKTRMHCMMLENCTYDFYEMTALNMAQRGLFGEVYHVEGAYVHNLDPYWDAYQGNWRLDYDQKHRGDNYPTHGIGPVCQVLDIHRGDKMDYLVSMDTPSYHGAAVAKEKMGVDEFANGDHTVTLIRTAKGKQIEIQHNVYAARPYSRMFQLTGTEGFANKYPTSSFSLKSENLPDKPIYAGLDGESSVPRDVYAQVTEDFKHPTTVEYEQKALEAGGHGGMDYIMDARLVYCLRNGLPLDEDVYDAAEWCCLTELSRLSIESGSMPVQVPDFTRGDWNKIKGYRHAGVEGQAPVK